MSPESGDRRSPPPRVRWLLLAFAGLALGLHLHPASAQTSGGGGVVPVIRLTDPRLLDQIERRLPGATPDRVATVARDFEAHLRAASPVLAERLASGRMDDAELESRLSVYLGGAGKAPEGGVAPTAGDPRSRVLAVLGRQPGVPASDAERIELAEAFLKALAARSRAVHEDLLARRVSDEALESRVAVFLENRRAPTVAVVRDLKGAAAEADRFVVASFGRPAERIPAIALRCVVETTEGARQLVVWRKRPDLFRLHLCDKGIVLMATGFDGSKGWMQLPARPGVELVGSMADVLRRSARFDHVLIGWEERGATLTLVSRDDATGVVRLRLREPDGTETTSTIDTVKGEEIASETRRSDGAVEESRFRDYRRFGVLAVPMVQESWSAGKLKSTTRIEEVVLNPGLLDVVFTKPKGGPLDLMDFMGALAVVAHSQGAGDGAAKSKGPQP